MELDDFTSVLDDLEISYREAGQSLVLQQCPCCGNDAWKVHMRLERENDDGPFFGRCYAGDCQQNFSSASYLYYMNVDDLIIRRLHGQDPESSLKRMTTDVDEILNMAPDVPESAPKIVSVDKDTDISKFFKVSDWLDHPAAVYALKRGVDPVAHQNVLIDPESNAVVFVVFGEGGQVEGYQKRFVNPSAPHLKTKSSFGFQKTKHLLHFPRERAKIVVCEGPFTAIAAWRFGYYAVCTFGSAVSEEQIKLIAELADKLKQEVGVAFDLDDAGRKGMARIRTGMFWKDQEIFRVVPGSGNDLNDAWMAGASVKEVRDPWGGPAIPDIPEFT